LILSAQNLNASSADPCLLNRSVTISLFSSWTTAITSLVMESMAINPALVASDPVYEPVAPFFTRLMPKFYGNHLCDAAEDRTALLEILFYFSPTSFSAPLHRLLSFVSFSSKHCNKGLGGQAVGGDREVIRIGGPGDDHMGAPRKRQVAGALHRAERLEI
jgi:hypothetical protein